MRFLTATKYFCWICQLCCTWFQILKLHICRNSSPIKILKAMEQPRGTIRKSVSGRPSIKATNVSDSKATIENRRSNSYETLNRSTATDESEDSDVLSEDLDDVHLEDDSVPYRIPECPVFQGIDDHLEDDRIPLRIPECSTFKGIKRLGNRKEQNNSSGLTPERPRFEAHQKREKINHSNASPKGYGADQNSLDALTGKYMWLLLAIILCLVGIGVAVNNTQSQSVVDDECIGKMRKIKQEMLPINEDVIISLQAGINETLTRNHPSVFLYLYKDASESYMDNLVSNMATYTSCGLNNQNIQPIELTSKELHSKEALKDYGYILARYKDDLEQRKVMVVKHLESVSGFVAQAFHSFCDEISPLVEKSVFIFTMRVDRFTKPEYKVVEETLLKKWEGLDNDIFMPLVTRITSMILNIKT